MDQAVASVSELEDQLQQMVAAEDYAAAAQLKQQLDDVLKRDTVATVLEVWPQAYACPCARRC